MSKDKTLGIYLKGVLNMYLIINWKDGHTTKLRFGVKCLIDIVAEDYIRNHGNNIISIIKEV